MILNRLIKNDKCRTDAEGNGPGLFQPFVWSFKEPFEVVKWSFKLHCSFPHPSLSSKSKDKNTEKLHINSRQLPEAS
jgi:hypothetical protein